jgi:hypothetical protein
MAAKWRKELNKNESSTARTIFVMPFKPTKTSNDTAFGKFFESGKEQATERLRLQPFARGFAAK